MSAPDLVPPGTTGGGAPVGGSGTIGTVPKWATTTTLGDSVITESSAGNVGIGTTSPAERLAVQAPSGVDSVLDILSLRNPSATNAGVRISLRNVYGDLGGVRARQTDNGAGADEGVLELQTSTNAVLSTKVTILADGNVGIGTTVPQTTLDSSGIVTSRTGASSAPLSPTEGIRFSLSAQPDAYVTTIYRNSIFNSVSSIPTDSSMQFRLGNGASSQATIMTLKGDGNVGIGTAGPGYLLTVAGVLAFDSGYGSAAPAYGCRAWVKFNGTGTPAITGSGNVSSITDLGVGNWGVNYTTAMVDANYAVFPAVAHPGGAGTPLYATIDATTSAPTTAQVRVFTLTNLNAQVDAANVYVTVFR